MAKLKWRGRSERGAIAVLVAIVVGTGVLTGTAALVVDVGNMYAERGQLQNGADAAAIAIAASCTVGACGDVTRTAQKYANANAKDGHADVTEVCGTFDTLRACSAPATNLAACIGSPPSENYVEVRVRTELPNGSTVLPPTFAAAMAGNSAAKGGTTVATCARMTGRSVCVSADNETYTHTFDGVAGDATVTAQKPLCPGERVPITLVAYTAPDDSTVFPQYVFDSDNQAFTSTSSLTLRFHVEVPDCYNQVDLAFRDGPISPLTAALYGDLKLGSGGEPGSRSTGPGGWHHGGTRICAPGPTTSFVPACDGTMAVSLANKAGANIDAVFTVTSGGTDTWVHVNAGATTSVPISVSNAGDVSVLDNLGRTTRASWAKPGGC